MNLKDTRTLRAAVTSAAAALYRACHETEDAATETEMRHIADILCAARSATDGAPLRAGDTRRIAEIWTKGSDCEAARAARGEATVPEPSQLGSQRWTEVMRDLARRAVAAKHSDTRTPEQVADDGVAFVMGPEPDPTHTPAVRRVVAWVVPGAAGPFESRLHAYEKAARMRMWSDAASAQRFRRRCGRYIKRAVSDRYSDMVQARLAAWLRHRDEKAGHR